MRLHKNPALKDEKYLRNVEKRENRFIKSRSGVAPTLFIAFFCVVVGLGVLWMFVGSALDSVSGYMSTQFPAGVYNSNNLAMYNIIRVGFPFFAMISIIIFVYISIKRKDREEPYYG